jgi:5-methylcytosine-specific restriction endonuclease McrA
MRPDLVAAVSLESPAVEGSDLEDLLTLLASVAGVDAVTAVRRRLSEQVLRSIEIGLLADAGVVDIALNPGLYLGREVQVLTDRLRGLLDQEPPEALVHHFRGLVLSRAAGAEGKVPVRAFESDVLRLYRRSSERLRCLDCGYHFVEGDLGQTRLDLARDLGLVFAKEKLSRRLRDPWKPGDKTELSIDHLVPEAGLGPTAPENLRIVCRFCNGEKRIYRWPGEASGRDVAAALLALGDPKHGTWAARASTYVAIVEGERTCAECGRTSDEVELTARPLFPRGTSTTVPWQMRSACYECYDPSA